METYIFLPYFDGRTLFKSYYVVWKLNKKNDINKKNESLNRTMQYGNSKKTKNAGEK